MIGNRCVRGPANSLPRRLRLATRQLRARAAVEVDAVDDPGIGQVVMREQAQVTRAPGRREQDRRMHAAAADGVHERHAARRARPTTRCSVCDRRWLRRRRDRRPAAAIRRGPCGSGRRDSSRTRAPAALVPPRAERMTIRRADRAAVTARRMAARRSSELAMAETSRRTVLTPIAASTFASCFTPASSLASNAALRIGQRAGRDHGAAHDEAVTDAGRRCSRRAP